VYFVKHFVDGHPKVAVHTSSYVVAAGVRQRERGT